MGLLQRLRTPISNTKGIALIMAVSAVSLLIYIAMEVMYDSNVEYIVNSQSLSGLKAYYAAKAGMDISLLRIKIYQTVKQKMGSNASQIPYLEQIWRFPLVWPLEISEGTSSIEKDEANKAVKESLMDATFRTDIEDEGSKIDLNDLASSSKTLAEITKKQVLQIFESEKRDNPDFNTKYSSYRFPELVNYISDWMSSKREGLNGGEKSAPYRDYKADGFPPNRGFRTVRELRLVPGMSDELYDLMEPRVTIYGLKGINPNSASKEVLMTLDPGITAEVAKKIQDRVNDSDQGGPFKGGEEGISAFWAFVTGPAGARLEQDPKTIPIVMDSMVSFKISSTGLFSGTARKITAIVLDLNQSAQRTSDLLKKDKKDEKPPDPAEKKPPPPALGPDGRPLPPGAPAQAKTEPIPKGPPRIVYWSEN
jgi:general secretion pathway protein K